jgi:regulator of cell morphogenesis and NO signaling
MTLTSDITADVSEDRWDQVPLGDLIDHILAVHHQPLHEELPRLESMAHKVLTKGCLRCVHQNKDPERLTEVHALCLELTAELKQHMMKEERILFPMIKQGRGAMAVGPISVMGHEHDWVVTTLRRLHELTNGYEVPAEACKRWIVWGHGLAALEEALHQHIHLENDILFPRALASKTI